MNLHRVVFNVVRFPYVRLRRVRGIFDRNKDTVMDDGKSGKMLINSPWTFLRERCELR
jgi:hypothetical protein